MSIVSSTVGSRTSTGWKRRSSAGAFSMFLRDSSSVVAPITCRSPPASAGLGIFAAALGPSGPHAGGQFVDEHDQLLRSAADLVDHGLEPLLELAAVFRPGDHPSQVESDDATVGKRLGNLVVDDALRDTFDDRGLAHARLAE